MLSVLLVILMGVGVSVQTVVNTRLRTYIQSPLLASFISFTIGTLFLVLMLVVQSAPIIPTASVWQSSPWWFWTGGALGAVWITLNIFVFLQLGPVQTSILPVLGQIVMGVLIDHFGWLGTHAKPASLLQIFGILCVLIGIVMAVASPLLKQWWLQRSQGQSTSVGIMSTNDANKSQGAWLWRILAVCAGAMVAMQTAINTQLNIVLGSKIQASFISFFVGTVLLFFVVAIKDKRFSNARLALGKNRPWWIWTGGIIGACFVMLSVVLVPILGVGQLLVLVLFGQLVGSICIEQFGLFGLPKKSLQMLQILGLLLLLIGVGIIRLIA